MRAAVHGAHAASFQEAVDAVFARQNFSQVLFLDGTDILEGGSVVRAKTLVERELFAAFGAGAHSEILPHLLFPDVLRRKKEIWGERGRKT
jgi:hypothetical protein